MGGHSNREPTVAAIVVFILFSLSLFVIGLLAGMTLSDLGLL